MCRRFSYSPTPVPNQPTSSFNKAANATSQVEYVKHNVSFCSLFLNFVEIQLTTHLLCVQYKLYRDCIIILRQECSYNPRAVLHRDADFSTTGIQMVSLPFVALQSISISIPLQYHFWTLFSNTWTPTIFIQLFCHSLGPKTLQIVIFHEFARFLKQHGTSVRDEVSFWIEFR